jgi:hypothetical protein
VIDQYGRVINRVDMYEENLDGLGGLQMVDVPMGAVDTLYSDTGDVLGVAALVAFLGLLGVAWLKRHGRETQTAT